MAELNYSIIIPHKNIPDLLQRCLDSIPKRDDIQIIIVDDNSDPDKVDFNHFPGVGEKCVEVYFTKEGKGAGYARNVGLKHARGKWLLFADADDFYVKDAWDTFDKYLNAQVDIIYFSVACVDSSTLMPASRNLRNNEVVTDFISGDENGEKLLRYTCWEPWNKIWRHEFIVSNDLQFEEIPRGNDAMFVLQGGDKANKIMAIEEQLYVVTYRPQSLSYKITKESFYSALLLKIRINKFYKAKGFKKFRLSVLYDLKQAYTLFGATEVLKAISLIFKNHGDFFIFFFDMKGYKNLIAKAARILTLQICVFLQVSVYISLLIIEFISNN